MNILGITAVALGLAAFALTHAKLRSSSRKLQVLAFCVFSFLAIPAALFTVYYLHLLPEQAWFYTLRSWRGTEYLAVFLGCAGGAAASLLPRRLLFLPLLCFLATAIVPYVKLFANQLSDDSFHDRWKEAACLQSTFSTCGPASVCTILRQFGSKRSEKEVARAAYTYSGGTEAWYLARYVRDRGLVARFVFRRTFSPDLELPAMVGVRIAGFGHSIAVLELKNDQVRFADPLLGEELLPLTAFQNRYEFTGFHMLIHQR